MSIEERIYKAKEAIEEGVDKINSDKNIVRVSLISSVIGAFIAIVVTLFYFAKKEERIYQAIGTLKEDLGKVTGDKKLEKEGAAEKATAKVKEVAKDVKYAIEGTIDGVKNIVKKDKE